MSTPLIGRNATIQYVSGGTALTIGYAQGCTEDFNADLIQEYQLNSDKAAILQPGNKHFKVSFNRMYIDNTFANIIYTNQLVDIVFGPAGSTTGSPKITIKNVVLNAHNITYDQKGIVAEKVSGEGNDRIVSNF